MNRGIFPTNDFFLIKTELKLCLKVSKIIKEYNFEETTAWGMADN